MFYQATLSYLQLREKVINYDIAPGMQLTIAELASETGSSVTPVREGLIRLAAEDFIDYRYGSGFFIKKPIEVFYQKEFESLFFALTRCLETTARDATDGDLQTFTQSLVSELEDCLVESVPDNEKLSRAMGKVYAALQQRDSVCAKQIDEAAAKTRFFREIDYFNCNSESQKILGVINLVERTGKRDITYIKRRMKSSMESRITTIPAVLEQMILALYRKFS